MTDIEEKMRRCLDSYKAVKRVLPKHKHQFESLFEYKSDDEDDSDIDVDSLEDGLDHCQPREEYGPISVLLKTLGHGSSQRLPFAHARSLRNYQ